MKDAWAKIVATMVIGLMGLILIPITLLYMVISDKAY